MPTMSTLPEDIRKEIMSILHRDGYITELEAQKRYQGPADVVSEYLAGLTAEGIAQYTPYSEDDTIHHAYRHLGGRDPIAWNHSNGLEELKACAAR